MVKPFAIKHFFSRFCVFASQYFYVLNPLRSPRSSRFLVLAVSASLMAAKHTSYYPT